MSLHTASAGAAPATSRPVKSRALTLLLALTGGVAIGNLYWAGWRAVTTADIAVSVVGLAVWAVGRHAALLDQPPRSPRPAKHLAAPTNR